MQVLEHVNSFIHTFITQENLPEGCSMLMLPVPTLSSSNLAFTPHMQFWKQRPHPCLRFRLRTQLVRGRLTGPACEHRICGAMKPRCLVEQIWGARALFLQGCRPL